MLGLGPFIKFNNISIDSLNDNGTLALTVTPLKNYKEGSVYTRIIFNARAIPVPAAVPLPSSVILMASGLLITAFLMRKRLNLRNAPA